MLRARAFHDGLVVVRPRARIQVTIFTVQKNGGPWRPAVYPPQRLVLISVGVVCVIDRYGCGPLAAIGGAFRRTAISVAFRRIAVRTALRGTCRLALVVGRALVEHHADGDLDRAARVVWQRDVHVTPVVTVNDVVAVDDFTRGL